MTCNWHTVVVTICGQNYTYKPHLTYLLVNWMLSNYLIQQSSKTRVVVCKSWMFIEQEIHFSQVRRVNSDAEITASDIFNQDYKSHKTVFWNVTRKGVGFCVVCLYRAVVQPGATVWVMDKAGSIIYNAQCYIGKRSQRHNRSQRHYRGWYFVLVF